ncbi:MAG TPA: flagellar M-ring protein FliF C-terminal domain-containing protein, partial [Nitrospiraceae bacterium]|nr:flagellar M-ring protein FliF C-terminal domain-containing protein [Nitrospiraceae bacterium]
GSYEPVKDSGAADAVRKYVPRPEAEMKQIEEIVKKAMGYSSERQDQVEVVNVQFGFEGDVGAGSAAAVDEAPSLLKTYAPYIRYGVGAVLFLLILLFVVRPLVAALTTPSPASFAQERVGGSSATVLSQNETPSLEQSQVLDLARNNPESTAVVVKQWLKAGT